AERLASASNRLAGLTDLRRDVGRGSIAPAAALDAYNTTIADLLNTNRGLASGIADPQLAQQVGAFVAVSRIKELAALERELFSEVLDRGRFAPGHFRRSPRPWPPGRCCCRSSRRPPPTLSGPCSSTPWSAPRSSGPGSCRRRPWPGRP